MPRFVPLLLASACWLVPSSLVGEEPTVSALVKQLADTESEKVCAAAKALGQRGAKDALPALKELLKSRHGRIKWSAAEAVWRLEHKTADVVPVFAELLTATEPDVRAAAAWRLGRLDVDRQTVLLLASALRDEVHEVRVQAGLALANLGRHTEPALPALVRAFGDNRLDESQSEQKSWITATTSPALPALVELTDETLPVLLEALREKKNPPGTDLATEMRQQALTLRVIHVLPAFGNRTVEPLLHLLEAKELGTRAAAFASLREVAKVHGLPNAAGDQLEKHLTDADEDVRSMAGRVLAWVRPANAKAATALTHLRPDRVELLADLERMYPHNETARAVLVRLLGDDDKETSKSAYRLLGKLEDSPARLLDVWTKALPHADTEVRLRALEALGKLGPQAMPAKAALHDRYSKESDY